MSGIPAGAGQLLGKRLGKFEILALLALGGTAEIYLARIGGAAGFEKYVVVKCLHDHLADDAEFVKMFLDEARLAAHLDHSNIVQTMELGQHEGRYYMVMEFLAGLSLAMIVRRVSERLPSTRLPVPLVLNILAQSSAGLHYAHEKAMNGRALGIVHRDISPQNLVVSFEGVVKIVDFGIAKAELRETHTRSGTIKGKFAYMSPEQCVANNVDRRTDVFALGVIAHELLTGRRLFKRPSPYETYQSVIQCEVEPPSQLEREIDPALDPVIMRALTKDKADRYPTAEAFGDALLGYLHHRGIGSGPGDVSRFFDSYFAQELEEHSGRMRELISGRDISADTGVSWGDADGDEEAIQIEDAAIDGADSVTGGGLAALHANADLFNRPPGAMSVLLDELGHGARADDDEMPAERTRIESNPLERVNELERLAANTPPPSSKKKRAGSLAAPAGVPQGSSPAVAAPGSPGMPVSGKFPDPANLPTVIAAAELPPEQAEPQPVSPFANAPTTIDIQPMGEVPPAASNFANAPTAVPPPASNFANAPTALAPDHGSPSWQRPQGDYPMMSAQLSAQIANGATVFPSDRRGMPQPPVPQQHPGPGPRMAESSGPHDYAAQAPQQHPQPPVRPPDSGQLPSYGREPGLGDPQRAANLMSPVGQQYPDVDWNAAAHTRARAVPPWLLAVLFVGALGIALALTIIIARVAR